MRESGGPKLHHTVLRPRVCMALSHPHHSTISKAFFLTHLTRVSLGVVMSTCALSPLRLRVIIRAVAGSSRLKQDFTLRFYQGTFTPERTTAQPKFGNLA